MKLKTLNRILSIGTTSLALGLTLGACGPQAFTPGSVSSAQTAGSMDIPPKVDLIMGISQSGTMKNIFPGIEQEIPAFVKGLQQSGWDYHFVTIPLSEYLPTSNIPLAQTVSVSNYDTNYFSLGSWLPPYPGASGGNLSLGIASSFFTQTFVFPAGVDAAHNDGHETGLQNEIDFLSRSDVKTAGTQGQNAIIRPDAVLAIVTLSNGEDTSGGQWVQVTNGYQWESTDSNYISEFANHVISVKGNAQLVKYFSLVAHLNTDCRGYGSRSGIRYESAATALGGQSIDICTNTLDASLAAVGASLQVQKLSYEKRYLVIGNQPNVTSIQITKYLNGDSGQAQTIAQDSTNGWSYAGYLSNMYTIDAPISMALATGYMIELHGSAKLHGSDTVTINYTNAGATVSQ